MNYDPNLAQGRHMAAQTVRLTFGQWEYRKVIDVKVGGNCSGLSNILSAALSNVIRELPTDGDFPQMLMERNGDTLTTDPDEDEDIDDWLGKMLVGAEIIAIEPRK